MPVIRPINLKDAQAFIDEHHRHNKAPIGHKLSVGLIDDSGAVIGVGTISRPVARGLDNGLNAEVTRVCTLGHPNACSMLYGACLRICKAWGYHKVFTYTQGSESGSSLRAVGFVQEEVLRARGSWAESSQQRQRDAAYDTGGVMRIRWSVTFAANKPVKAVLQF